MNTNKPASGTGLAASSFKSRSSEDFDVMEYNAVHRRMSLPLIDDPHSRNNEEHVLRRRKWKLLALGGALVAITMVVALSMDFDRRRTVQTVRKRRLSGLSFQKTSDTSAVCKIFPTASVTSNAGTCADIGRTMMLSKNGSAVDAAIAVLLCEELFEPESMGIGGGFFMTVYDRTNGNASVIDAREVAPIAADSDIFHGNKNASQRGPLSVAVPGVIKGLQLAHQNWGRLPWKDLFEPTIELCRQGVPVQKSLAYAMRAQRKMILADSGLRSVFVDPETGDLYKENDTLKRTDLGNTLEIIAKEGADVFYTKLAKQLVDELQAIGAILTMEDFANYKALKKAPIQVELSEGLRLYSVPPPGSGIIISHILLILDGYRNDMAKRDNDSEVLKYHRTVEAFKYGYAQRALLGDDQFIDMSELIRNLTSPEIAAHTRSLIWDNRTFESAHYSHEFQVPDHGTSHTSVVAPNGDAVSVTSTINLWFGSGIMSPSTGLIFNDEMDDFASKNIINYFGLPPAHNNFIAPGKRPVSSMCASVLVDDDGDVQLVTGASGGTFITTSTSLTTIRNLWMKLDLAESTTEPRLHHQLYPPTISYETGFPQFIIDGLLKIGHNATMDKVNSIVNSIRRLEDGSLFTCADGRKNGDVSGF